MAPLDSLHQVHVPVLWPPKQDTAPGGILEEQSRESTIICLDLLAMVLVMLPRMDFWAVSERKLSHSYPVPTLPFMPPSGPAAGTKHLSPLPALVALSPILPTSAGPGPGPALPGSALLLYSFNQFLVLHHTLPCLCQHIKHLPHAH